MTASVLELHNEPVMACGCGCKDWYLRCEPNKKLRHIIAFECAGCGFRIECDVRLIESGDDFLPNETLLS